MALPTTTRPSPPLSPLAPRYCGSYGALEGGNSAWAFDLLLGPKEPVAIFEKEEHSGRWLRSHLHRTDSLTKLGATHNPSAARLVRDCEPDGTRTARSVDELWELLAAHSSEHNVITASGVREDGVGEGGAPSPLNGERRDNLMTHHAYSILRVVAVETAASGRVRLVHLRNTWGSDKTWAGAWGDTSSKWAEHPEVATAVGFKGVPDGTFWMELEQVRSPASSHELP